MPQCVRSMPRKAKSKWTTGAKRQLPFCCNGLSSGDHCVARSSVQNVHDNGNVWSCAHRIKLLVKTHTRLSLLIDISSLTQLYPGFPQPTCKAFHKLAADLRESIGPLQICWHPEYILSSQKLLRWTDRNYRPLLLSSGIFGNQNIIKRTAVSDLYLSQQFFWGDVESRTIQQQFTQLVIQKGCPIYRCICCWSFRSKSASANSATPRTLPILKQTRWNHICSPWIS